MRRDFDESSAGQESRLMLAAITMKNQDKENRNEWDRARDRLVTEIVRLGFREELGELVARQLGSPKAMERMLGYLHNVRPRSEELIVDEMLAIRSDIERWREKKAAEEANARYNEILYYGLGNDDE